MYDFGQVGRLLRQDWSNPTDLARELYGMFTSKDSRRMANPVNLAVPKGQTGIVISRENAPGPAATALRDQTTVKNTNRTNVPTTERPDVVRTDLTPQRAPKDALDIATRNPRLTSGDGPAFPQSTDQSPTSANFGRSPTFNRPQTPNRSLNGPQVQTGPDFKPVRPDAGPLGPSAKGGYSNPVFEASGEIRFSGVTPVQFDAPPQVFNPITDEYEDYSFDGYLTRVPDDDDGGDGASWGQVLSGKGNTYIMNIFDDPDPDTATDGPQSVKCLNLDAKEVIPPGTWIYPVVQSGGESGLWYALVPMWI
jgi:hypothetical protein